MVPGSGQYKANDPTTYQAASIKVADSYVAPLSRSSFKPTAAALALPHIARSPFASGSKSVDDDMVVSRDAPIADATGVDRAGQDVAEIRDDNLTPDVTIRDDNDSAFCIGCRDLEHLHSDPMVTREEPQVSTWSRLWPWVAGGGVALAVTLLALTVVRRG